MKQKRPLYRKVNTRARNVHHCHGGDYKNQRSSKLEKISDVNKSSMSRGKRRGLDYTPLFKFLISKIGEDWNMVFSEVKERLDQLDPVFWIVALTQEEKKDYVRLGESSYYSGLFVDDDNRLQIVNPELGPESLEPTCPCCTHTFNGVPFTRKYQGQE